MSACIPIKYIFSDLLTTQTDHHHSQGALRFATEISPLLNYHYPNKGVFVMENNLNNPQRLTQTCRIKIIKKHVWLDVKIAKVFEKNNKS